VLPHSAISSRRAIDPQGNVEFIGGSMGRGDKRTRKGKIFKGSYGKTRPRGLKKKTAQPAAKASGRKST
jgi:30S ribosomal protein S31